MSKVMLVNVTHVEETRVAVLDQGVLEAYEIETINQANIKGNIYNAVVENVHPSLEAGFVKLAPDQKGFLPLDEVNFKLLPARGDNTKAGKIGQHLAPNQKILAQVVREPFGGKPPTVSTYFSLAGRYLVLMPGVDSAGVSRKIEDPAQREKLKQLVEELNPPEGFGLIVRTAGMGQTKIELQRDLRYLLRLWQSIQRASAATEFPGLVYREADLVIRTIRDHFTPEISEVWIDREDAYERALEFMRDVMPTKAKTLHLYDGGRPLFNKFNLEEQIESIFKRRVALPSGGEIVIDGTEALTAIDVNSKGAKRVGDAEETATQTNVEAAAEIARQIRLRDLGGLIVIDFIDMMASRNQKKVEKAVRDAFKGDRAKNDITRISKLGLMELARQRIKVAKMGAMYTACPTCEGYGLVKTVESAALSALRKLQTRSSRGEHGRIRLSLPTEVATWILAAKQEDVSEIERRHAVTVEVVPLANLLRHQTEFEGFPREKGSVAPSLPPPPAGPPRIAPRTNDPQPLLPMMGPTDPGAGGGAADGAVPSESAQPTEQEGSDLTDVVRKRRRRRRRRGAGPASEVANNDGPSAVLESANVLERDTDDGSDDEELGEEETPPGEARSSSSTSVIAESGGADGRPRRRRRRRRRAGTVGAPVAESPARPDVPRPESTPPSLRDFEDVAVPRGIRSEELMPAAVGGRGSRPRRGGDGGPFRESRRGGGRRGPGGRHSGGGGD